MHAQAQRRAWASALGAACLVLATAAPAQQTAGQAAASAGGGSTSANGGTGGVGLGGVGPGVGARPGAAGGAGGVDEAEPPGDGAIVGPRARRDSRQLLGERPDLAASAPRNAGQRALLLDESRRPASTAPAPAGR